MPASIVAGAELLTERSILGMLVTAMSQPYSGSDWINQICSPWQQIGEEGKFPIGGSTPYFARKRDATGYERTRVREVTTKNDEFDVGLELVEKWLRRDRVGLLQEQANGFAFAARQELPARLGSEQLGDAETKIGYDEVAFFSALHEWGKSGAQSNLLEFSAAADFPADAAVGAGGPNKPSREAVAWAISEAVIHGQHFKNDRGKFSGLMYKRFGLMGTKKTFKRLNGSIDPKEMDAGIKLNEVHYLMNAGYQFQSWLNPLLNDAFDVDGEFNFLLFLLDHPSWPLIRHFEQIAGGDDEGIDYRMKGYDTEHFTDNRSLQIKGHCSREITLGEPLSVIKVRIVA